MEEFLTKVYPLIQKGATVSTDSRSIDQNTIFFALKGDKFDGNDFVLQSIENGALLAISDKSDIPAHEKIVNVNDSLEALQSLAKFHRQTLSIPVIGITGSNGKTTTKELISCVLAQKFNTLFTKGNFNNHIGLPLTILNIKPSHEIAVIEMGANHLGEIDLLCNIAMPTHGLITNIGKAHIEGFGSEKNVIIAKTELYRYLEETDGIIFLNADNEILSKNCSGKKLVTYGTHKGTNYQGIIMNTYPYVQIGFSIQDTKNDQLPTQEFTRIQSNLVGSYNFENLLVAASIGHYFGVELPLLKNAIEEYFPSNNRSQFKNSGKNNIILDAYNANPTSMKAAIENFAGINAKPKAIILGDMLELGHISSDEHQEILNFALNTNTDLLILVGKEFGSIPVKKSNVVQFPDYRKAMVWLDKNPLNGYTILVKGSRGIQLERLENLL